MAGAVPKNLHHTRPRQLGEPTPFGTIRAQLLAKRDDRALTLRTTDWVHPVIWRRNCQRWGIARFGTKEGLPRATQGSCPGSHLERTKTADPVPRKEQREGQICTLYRRAEGMAGRNQLTAGATIK